MHLGVRSHARAAHSPVVVFEGLLFKDVEDESRVERLPQGGPNHGMHVVLTVIWAVLVATVLVIRITICSTVFVLRITCSNGDRVHQIVVKLTYVHELISVHRTQFSSLDLL